jgi:inner membrane protein
MPSPLGHALAGVAIAWSAEAIKRRQIDFTRGSTLAVAAAGLAVAADLDWLYPPAHRAMTHSLVAAVAAAALIAIVKRRERSADTAVVALACGLAYASHLLLDWLGGDTKIPAGIQLLWPYSNDWFISPVGVFRATDLGGFFKPWTMVSNALAVLRELLVMVPIAVAAHAWRRRRLHRLASMRTTR